jgi:hypothetical protein
VAHHPRPFKLIVDLDRNRDRSRIEIRKSLIVIDCSIRDYEVRFDHDYDHDPRLVTCHSGSDSGRNAQYSWCEPLT